MTPSNEPAATTAPFAPTTVTALRHHLTRLPAPQNPLWRGHPAYADTMNTLAQAPPLVKDTDLPRLRAALAHAAHGRAIVVQAGDCAESFYQCTPEAVHARLDMLDRFAGLLGDRTDLPVVRIGRIGGQYAKPRSSPVEQHDGRTLPSFRGHLVNSEVPSRAARQADPRRMLWAYQASATTLGWVDEHRTRPDNPRPDNPGPGQGPDLGPWSSHEALVVDYEAGLLRDSPHLTGPYLASTHLPWIGERTRDPDGVHVRMLAAVANPVGCKVGPHADPAELRRLCDLLDPDRTPGRLVLIARMGRDHAARALPRLVAAVRAGGHPAVWLCDPMHGNTVTAAGGLKTRHLDALTDEVRIFLDTLADHHTPPGGIHLEAAGEQVTECVGGPVADEHDLTRHYTTLCDPRLSPEQGLELIASCF